MEGVQKRVPSPRRGWGDGGYRKVCMYDERREGLLNGLLRRRCPNSVVGLEQGVVLVGEHHFFHS